MKPPCDRGAACDRCGQWATHAHIVPWATDPVRVLLACPACDPGGYHFPLDCYGRPVDRGMWAHLADKDLRAVILLARRLRRLPTDRGVVPSGEIRFVPMAQLAADHHVRVRAYQSYLKRARER